ncbi:ParA family protein [Mucilaginibacter sp. X5P1]|uniref:ParA family protein n=1 Tax=Mucilaginibacter sp. X5P1 TaxID=2723088 RepID=UPI00161A6213|nr:ParA family protein [Mucilaginibacter sp. X5P1]MBB6137674.1 chromosome partitioning protein [Mucilaginibacter sp. X5P1]
MIIIIGNQKGGAGKSTLTLLLANYLTLVKKRTVTVIDMDYQESLSQKFEKAKVLENEEPYEVVKAALEDFPDLLEVMKTDSQALILIDLPGKLDDDGLLPVFKAAELVICPFAYDEFSFESTVLFSVVLKKVSPDCRLLFIPNRVKANVKYDTQVDVNEQLSKFGPVLQAIPDRIDFQRTSTFQTPLAVFPVVRPVFDALYKQYLKLTPDE